MKGDILPALTSSGERRNDADAGYAFRCDARVKFVCLVVYVVAALHARTPIAIGLCALTAVAMAAATRLKLRSVAKAIRPLAVILLFTGVMQVLYVQQGAVLVQLGPIAVTQGALVAAATMVAGLACVMVVSLAFMRCTSSDQFVSMLDWLLGPFRALGVRTGSFMLALTVAFRFIPVFADEFGQLKRAQIARHAGFDGSVRERVASYARLFPPLIRSSFRRADRLADTFVSRCFTGASHVVLHPQHVHARDFALIAIFVALFSATMLF